MYDESLLDAGVSGFLLHSTGPAIYPCTRSGYPRSWPGHGYYIVESSLGIRMETGVGKGSSRWALIGLSGDLSQPHGGH